MNLKIQMLAVILLLIPFTIQGQTDRYAVAGRIAFQNRGVIYVFLVTEEDFKTPLTGTQVLQLEIGSDEIKENEVTFRFEKVEAGIYGIRCFQDVNGNGELDGGLRGPAEPWGMSWQSEKPKKWPRFPHIAFEVKQDVNDLYIMLQQ
jgi:uncharacterized protein (DUF2141 family)